MLHNGKLFWRSLGYLRVATQLHTPQAQRADLRYNYSLSKIEITTERISSNL